MAEPLDILILGCSVAGPALATFLLQQRDWTAHDAPPPPRITLVERARTLRTEGQNVDIRGVGVDLIRQLDIEEEIRAATTGEEGVKLVDAQDRVWAAIPAGNAGARSPTSEIEILRGSLAVICYRRAQSESEHVKKLTGGKYKGIEFIFGDYLAELSQDKEKVEVRFVRSGEKRRFDIVVGADGLQSWTRNAVFSNTSAGHDGPVKRLGMYAAFFSMPKAPHDTMWRRWFHAPGRRGIMLRPDAQHGRTTALLSIVFDGSEEVRKREARFIELARHGTSPDAQKALIDESFRDSGWTETERVVAAMHDTSDFYYDMVAQVQLDRWNKGRVVLLGDAAPSAGVAKLVIVPRQFQEWGTTLALTGASTLARSINSHLIHADQNHNSNYENAFRQYEKEMRPLVTRAQKLAPGMPRLIHPNTAWGVWILNMFGYVMTSAGQFIMRWWRCGAGPPADDDSGKTDDQDWEWEEEGALNDW